MESKILIVTITSTSIMDGAREPGACRPPCWMDSARFTAEPSSLKKKNTKSFHWQQNVHHLMGEEKSDNNQLNQFWASNAATRGLLLGRITCMLEILCKIK